MYRGKECHLSEEKKKFALRLVIGDKVREVTYEELALSNNLAQEALVRLLIQKKIITPEELLKVLQEVKNERYRSLDDSEKSALTT